MSSIAGTAKHLQSVNDHAKSIVSRKDRFGETTALLREISKWEEMKEKSLRIRKHLSHMIDTIHFFSFFFNWKTILLIECSLNHSCKHSTNVY